MADSSDVRIPDPRENTARRRINAVVLATIFAACMALGFTYLLIPKLDRSLAHRASRYQVAVLDEAGRPIGTVAAVPGRAQRIVVKSPDGTTLQVRTIEEYRAANGTPLEYGTLVGAPADSQYVGRLIRIDGANVTTVPGDKVFTIGPDDTQSMLVKIDEPTNPGSQGEHELVVKPADLVFVAGRVTPFPSRETLRKWGINDEELSHIGNRGTYLRATLVEDLNP